MPNPKSQLACKKEVRKVMLTKLILHMTKKYTEMPKYCLFQSKFQILFLSSSVSTVKWALLPSSITQNKVSFEVLFNDTQKLLRLYSISDR